MTGPAPPRVPRRSTTRTRRPAALSSPARPGMPHGLARRHILLPFVLGETGESPGPEHLRSGPRQHPPSCRLVNWRVRRFSSCPRCFRRSVWLSFPGAGSLRRGFPEPHWKSRLSRQSVCPGPGFSILKPPPGFCATERDVIRGMRAASCRTRSRRQQSWMSARPDGCCGAPRGYTSMPREGRLLHR